MQSTFFDLCPIIDRVGLRPPTMLLPCNPSVCADDDGWRCLVRTVNYRLGPDGKLFPFQPPLHINSITWDIQLDEALRQTGRRQIDDRAVRRDHGHVNQGGFEDARLFHWRGGWWFTASVATFDGGMTVGMALAELTAEGIGSFTYFPSPVGATFEKNWAPCVLGDDLYLVYWISPTVIYRVEGESLRIVRDGPGSPLLAGWSGSSQLVDWDGHWLTVVHGKGMMNNPHGHSMPLYHHRFALLDRDWNTVGVSRPFVFESLGVEFCAGLAVKGDRVVLSYGVADSQAILVETERAAIQALLSPDLSGIDGRA